MNKRYHAFSRAVLTFIVALSIAFFYKEAHGNFTNLRFVDKTLHLKGAKGEKIRDFFIKENKVILVKEDYNKIKEKININTATEYDLMKLPSVGIKTAEKIIEYRKKAPFKNKEELKNIAGIGDKKYANMLDYVTIE